MLRKLLPVVALFFVALVIFPPAAKAVHEFAHEHEESCEVDGDHFCQHEHSCSVCDYTLSPSLTPQWQSFELNEEVVTGPISTTLYTSDHLSHNGFSFSLRGPPAC